MPEPSDEIAAAERRGDPYLVFAGPEGRERVVSLPDSWERATVGRGLSADVCLSWDDDVSRIHAELCRFGDEWVLIDEGLSRNGSFVNGERIGGRRALLDGDRLRFGKTEVGFHAPFQIADPTRSATAVDLDPPT
jgi:pSer/pThr/pTyr-binding forkhead associated (FHA) protein